jgi:tripartite-type tricarboxylate transporter receptor subunit TctC
MTHVPYRDFGQLYTAVATQDVDWALGSIASAGGFERSGKLRFLALAASHRDALYPAVPATAEFPELKDFQVSGWAGLFAPHAIDDAQRDRLSADVAQALVAPEVAEHYRTLAYEAPLLDAKAFADLIRHETVAWSDVIRKVGLRLDT